MKTKNLVLLVSLLIDIIWLAMAIVDYIYYKQIEGESESDDMNKVKRLQNIKLLNISIISLMVGLIILLYILEWKSLS